MAAILKIDLSPCLSEKSSDFYEILYTAAYFELDERHVIKNEKVALDRLRVRQDVFLVFIKVLEIWERLKVEKTNIYLDSRSGLDPDLGFFFLNDAINLIGRTANSSRR